MWTNSLSIEQTFVGFNYAKTISHLKEEKLTKDNERIPHLLTHKNNLSWSVCPWNVSIFAHSNTQTQTQACTHRISKTTNDVYLWLCLCLCVTVILFETRTIPLNFSLGLLLLTTSFLRFSLSLSLPKLTYNSSFPFHKAPLHTFSSHCINQQNVSTFSFFVHFLCILGLCFFFHPFFVFVPFFKSFSFFVHYPFVFFTLWSQFQPQNLNFHPLLPFSWFCF